MHGEMWWRACWPSTETIRVCQNMCIRDSGLSADSVEEGVWKTSFLQWRDSDNISWVFHTMKCNWGRLGLEAGVCGEVDKVHKHLIPPKLFFFFKPLVFKKKWLAVCFLMPPAPQTISYQAPEVDLMKFCPKDPEKISVRCDWVVTMCYCLCYFEGQNLLHCLFKTWNISHVSIPRLSVFPP